MFDPKDITTRLLSYIYLINVKILLQHHPCVNQSTGYQAVQRLNVLETSDFRIVLKGLTPVV